MDAFMFYVGVAVWSFFLAWWIVFNVLPNSPLKHMGKARTNAHGGHTAHEGPSFNSGRTGHHLPPSAAPAPATSHYPPIKKSEEHAPPRHSSHDGFKAYATDGELTVEDIVKALSRGHS